MQERKKKHAARFNYYQGCYSDTYPIIVQSHLCLKTTSQKRPFCKFKDHTLLIE